MFMCRSVSSGPGTICFYVQGWTEISVCIFTADFQAQEGGWHRWAGWILSVNPRPLINITLQFPVNRLMCRSVSSGPGTICFYVQGWTEISVCIFTADFRIICHLCTMQICIWLTSLGVFSTRALSTYTSPQHEKHQPTSDIVDVDKVGPTTSKIAHHRNLEVAHAVHQCVSRFLLK